MAQTDLSSEMKKQLQDERTALVREQQELKRQIDALDRKNRSVALLQKWENITQFKREVVALQRKYGLSDSDLKQGVYMAKYRIGRKLTDNVLEVQKAGMNEAAAEEAAKSWYADLAFKETRRRRKSTKRAVLTITNDKIDKFQVSKGDSKRTDTSVGRENIKGTI
jgi:hypothetical protein